MKLWKELTVAQAIVVGLLVIASVVAFDFAKQPKYSMPTPGLLLDASSGETWVAREGRWKSMASFTGHGEQLPQSPADTSH